MAATVYRLPQRHTSTDPDYSELARLDFLVDELVEKYGLVTTAGLLEGIASGLRRATTQECSMDEKAIEALASGEPDPHDIWIAVVSYNVKGDGRGFWQGDLFHGEADAPEAYFTLPMEGTRAQAVDRAHEKWPHAEIHIEDECHECDGSGKHEDDDEVDDCSVCGGEGVYRTLWSGK